MSQEHPTYPQIKTLWRLYKSGTNNGTCFIKFRNKWTRQKDGSLWGIWSNRNWVIRPDGMNHYLGDMR